MEATTLEQVGAETFISLGFATDENRQSGVIKRATTNNAK